MTGNLLFGRREFLLLLGGAAAMRSHDAGAQVSATPVIGFLNSASPNEFAHFVATFHKGLSETGYAEGK